MPPTGGNLKQRIYIPVIVTTAQIQFCAMDPSTINADDGKASKVELKDVWGIRFQNIDHAAGTDRALVARARVRTTAWPARAAMTTEATEATKAIARGWRRRRQAQVHPDKCHGTRCLPQLLLRDSEIQRSIQLIVQININFVLTYWPWAGIIVDREMHIGRCIHGGLFFEELLVRGSSATDIHS
jgi:hypothetical protein